MPFIPHTESEIQEMLAVIGVNAIDDLFTEIPLAIKRTELNQLPAGLTEMELTRLINLQAQKNKNGLCFIGAGAYEHHIPAAVWDLASRGEFMTAYTPYQAEASQGTLQLIYEYQSMISSLTGMDYANASLYDGATALAEALLMAVRSNKRSQSSRVLVPKTLHPFYRQTLTTILQQQNVELIDIPFSKEGTIPVTELQPWHQEDIAALVIQQPNFFGSFESVDQLTNWAHQHNILVIAVVNPTALGLIREPGQWGDKGADIVCGEGQPLGIPLAGGGPYFGFMCCKKKWVRQMPGRIVGKTTDQAGNSGFTLTLQTREQHIRRSKATSNICTNQGLLVTAATIYMSLLGPTGLQRVAQRCHHNAQQLARQLTQVPDVHLLFSHAFFHEFVLQLPCQASKLLAKLSHAGIQGGLDLGSLYPELGNALLVCVTETKTQQDLDFYQDQFSQLITSCA